MYVLKGETVRRLVILPTDYKNVDAYIVSEFVMLEYFKSEGSLQCEENKAAALEACKPYACPPPPPPP